MKIKYYPESDALYLEFSSNLIVDTHYLEGDDCVLVVFDENNQLAAMTIECASTRANLPELLLVMPAKIVQQEEKVAA